MIYVLTYALNLIAFVLIWRWGGTWDRAAVAGLVLSIILGPWVSLIDIGSWRAGIAVLNTAVLAMLWVCARKADRWWLIAASSLQLVTVASHAIPWLTPVNQVSSGYLLRRGLWFALSGLFFLAAFELRAAQPYRLMKGKFHVHDPV